MGKKDNLTKRYLADPKVFADAFNYFLFDGKQVIRPGSLRDQDPTEISVMKKTGKLATDQKMRDLLRLCTIKRSRHATLVLLGIEAQARISYMMPVKNNLYDALNYSAQVEAIRKEHMEKGDLKDGAELMSGFTKKDKILPVITLCICFDSEVWDAPESLHDMFCKLDPKIKPYINDYRLNLITPQGIRDFTKFSSELGILMEFIKNSNDKNRLHDIIETRDEYKSVGVDTIDMINTYTNAKISKEGAEGGKVDMCTAIQGIYEDGKTEGRKEGRMEGADMLAKLLKLLNPGSKEFDRALNADEKERRRLYKKYKIID